MAGLKNAEVKVQSVVDVGFEKRVYTGNEGQGCMGAKAVLVSIQV